MNLCRLALALGAAVPFAAHASDQAPLMRRYPGYPPGDYGYQPQARQGRLCSIPLAGGISYDARITRFCSFSPEFFYTWHQVPNGTAYADDVSSVYGLRLNLTWYLH